MFVKVFKAVFGVGAGLAATGALIAAMIGVATIIANVAQRRPHEEVQRAAPMEAAPDIERIVRAMLRAEAAGNREDAEKLKQYLRRVLGETMKLADFRKQYAEYNDMSDQQIADALYKKYYSDMPRADFDKLVGYGGSVDGAKFVVSLSNGSTVEFPIGTPNETVRDVIARNFPGATIVNGPKGLAP
jgi:hypothetical protein